MRRFAIAALLSIATISPAAAERAAGRTLLIADLRVIDVERGAVDGPLDIAIRGGEIADVAADLRAAFTAGEPGGARVLEGDGRYVIPGLWDAHVHVFSDPAEAAIAFDTYLINGITGIRDMGGLAPFEAQRRIADAVESGERRGPRLILSGAWVDGSPGSWPGMFLADTPMEARARVAAIARQGWAAVKAYSMLSEETYLALAGASEAVGLPLVGHVPEGVTLGQAIVAGQAGIEHFGRVTKACSSEERAMTGRVREALGSGDPLNAMIAEMASHNAIVLDTWEERRCRETVEAMATAGLRVSPTLMVSDFYRGVRPAADALRMRLLPPAVREAWRQPDFRLEAMTDELHALAERSIALDRKTFAMAAEAGVALLASTDASWANPYLFHGFSLLDELDRYVEIGLTPREALHTATVAPARFLGEPGERAAIAAGQRADLVLLAANPLEDLSALRTPRAVVANGNAYDEATLTAIREALLVGNGPAPVPVR